MIGYVPRSRGRTGIFGLLPAQPSLPPSALPSWRRPSGTRACARNCIPPRTRKTIYMPAPSARLPMMPYPDIDDEAPRGGAIVWLLIADALALLCGALAVGLYLLRLVR